MFNLASPVYCGSDIGSIKRFTEEDFFASDVIGFLKDVARSLYNSDIKFSEQIDRI